VYVCTAKDAVTSSPSSTSSVAGRVGGGADVGAVYNGAGQTNNRDARNTDPTAATAAAAVNAGASSSELSESDNEAVLNRSSTDYNRPGICE